MAEARRHVALQKSFGVDVSVLDPHGVRELCPYLHTDDLAGATYTPRDGFADPYLATTAIAARARGLGVTIRLAEAVQGFVRDGSRVTGVVTAKETVHAGAVVVATGCWSGNVGTLAGVDIPVVPYRRHKFITAPFPTDNIPARTPFIIDMAQAISLRREGEGVLLGIGRADDGGHFDTEIDRSLEPLIVERAVHRAPALADAQLMRGWAGLYEMTPDQTGIVSAVDGVAGLYVIAGFSGHGFMHGPIAGELMAELITGAPPSIDIAPLALSRFAAGRAERESLTFV